MEQLARERLAKTVPVALGRSWTPEMKLKRKILPAPVGLAISEMHSGFVILFSSPVANKFEFQMWQLSLLGYAGIQSRRQDYSVRATIEPGFETTSRLI